MNGDQYQNSFPAPRTLNGGLVTPQRQPPVQQQVPPPPVRQSALIQPPFQQQFPPPPEGGGKEIIQERTNGGLIAGIVIVAIIAIVGFGIAIGAITGNVKNNSIGAAELKDTDTYTLGNLNVTHDSNLGTVGTDKTTILGELDLSGANLEGSLLPDEDDKWTLGSQTKRWKDLFISDGVSVDGGMSVSGNTNLKGLVTVGASIYPDANGVYDIGSPDKPFNSIYANVVHGVCYTYSVVPNEDDVDTLGSGTSTWKQIFLGSGGISCRGPAEIGEGLSVRGDIKIVTNPSNGVSISSVSISSGAVANLNIEGIGSNAATLINNMDTVQIDTVGSFKASGASINLVGPTTYYRQEMPTPGDSFSAGIQYITPSTGTLNLPAPQPNYLYEFTFIASEDGASVRINAGASGSSILGSFMNPSAGVSYNSNPGSSPNIKLLPGSSAGNRLTLISQSTDKYFITNGFGKWEFY